MTPLSPQLLIATTRALAGIGVNSEPGWKEATLPALDARTVPGEARRVSWDARFVLQCGYWAHYDHRTRTSSWPIPLTLTTPELAVFGKARGVLYDEPEAGDIFLQYAAHRRAFVHSGVIVDVLERIVAGLTMHYNVYTVEADTDEAGMLGGGKTMRVRRRLSPMLGDCFLRWVELEKRACSGARGAYRSVRAAGRRA